MPVGNFMVKVNCPIAGRDTPANSTKLPGQFRCCKCGQLHPKQ